MFAISGLAVLSLAAVGARSSYLDWGPYPPVAPFTTNRLPHSWSLVNMIFPVVGETRWGNDYDVSRGNYRHTGIDIVANKMTPIVAPFAGTLGFKADTFWIYGENGWAMLGTHLNDDNLGRHDHSGGRDVMFAPNLKPGQHVFPGQFIGYVGESGNATGPHLHFELYAPHNDVRNIVNPWPSLKRAQHIKAARVVIPEKEEKPTDGSLRFEGCIRKVDPEVGKITVLVYAKQLPSGHVVPITQPRYLRVHVSQSTLDTLNGWDDLKALRQTDPVGVYLPYSSNEEGKTVERLLLPSDD